MASVNSINLLQTNWVSSTHPSVEGYPSVQPNNITFSYLGNPEKSINIPVTLTKRIRLISRYPQYSFTFDIKTRGNYGGYYYITLNFYDNLNILDTISSGMGTIKDGKITFNTNQKISYPITTKISLKSSKDLTNASICIINITGCDSLNWKGYWGPTISNIALFGINQPITTTMKPLNLLNPNFIQSEWTGTFDTTGNGSSGNPIIRNNGLIFSFNRSSVNKLLKNLPGAFKYILSFDIKTYAFGPKGNGGYLQINVNFYNSNGVQIGSLVYGNISTPIPAYLTKTTLSQETTQNMSSATYCNIIITGKDNAFWLGFYGPSISNLSLMPLM